MTSDDLNPLILDKIKQVVDDPQVREFIYDALKIEREYAVFKRGKMGEYEKALASYVGEE